MSLADLKGQMNTLSVEDTHYLYRNKFPKIIMARSQWLGRFLLVMSPDKIVGLIILLCKLVGRANSPLAVVVM